MGSDKKVDPTTQLDHSDIPTDEFHVQKRERALGAHCLLMCKVLLLPAYYTVTASTAGLYSL